VTDQREPTENEIALNRLWNDLVRGTAAERPHDLPPGDVQRLRQFHERAARFQPGLVRERAWLETLDRIDPNRPQEESSMNSYTSALPADFRPRLNGRVGSRVPYQRLAPATSGQHERRYGAVGWLAAVAVILIGLALGYRVFDPFSDDIERRLSIPALVATVGTPETSVDRTLVAFPLPADVFPDGGMSTVGVRHFTIPANTESSWSGTSGELSPGMWGDYVLAGTLTMTSEQPVEIIRGAGSGNLETVPAGTPITLAASDTVIHRTQHGKSWRAGPEPVEIISWFAIGVRWATYPQPNGWEETGFDFHNSRILPGSNTVRLAQRELELDEVVPAPLKGGLQFGVMVPGGDAFLRVRSDMSIRTGGTEDPVTVYILTIERAESGEATPVASPTG
jgi:hypothetical protein